MSYKKEDKEVHELLKKIDPHYRVKSSLVDTYGENNYFVKMFDEDIETLKYMDNLRGDNWSGLEDTIENKTIYKNEIMYFLNPSNDEIVRYEISCCLDHISDVYGLYYLLYSLKNCYTVQKLPISDRKKKNSEKEKFKTKKNKAIELLSYFEVDNETIKQIKNKKFDEDTYDWNYQQTRVKNIKHILREMLISDYKMGKNRTDEVMKLFKYLPKSSD